MKKKKHVVRSSILRFDHNLETLQKSFSRNIRAKRFSPVVKTAAISKVFNYRYTKRNNMKPVSHYYNYL